MIKTRSFLRDFLQQVEASTKAVDSYRLLTLKQFLSVFKSLQTQTAAIKDSPSSPDSSEPSSPTKTKRDNDDDGAAASSSSPRKPRPLLISASMFLDDALEGTSLEECCVCLERKPDVILPCAHSYCLPCIEQWNVNHKTCPVCRETVQSTDDGWVRLILDEKTESNGSPQVISDGPDSIDIATEIQKSLMEIASTP